MRVAKNTWSAQFWWRHTDPFAKVPLDGVSHVSSNRTLLLLSPCMPWGEHNSGKDRARIWAAVASTVPKEEEIASSVVDTLFQIAYHKLLSPHLHSDARSWFTLRPSLPPVCKGRALGSYLDVVQMVRDLKDIEILKSYLLLIWSEWDILDSGGYPRVQISIREDFSGIKMSSHRADLLQRLDHVLGQLDRGLEHFRREKPWLNEAHLQRRKDQYGRLRKILLEVDQEVLEVLTRASPRLTALFELPTHAAAHRITFDVHVCAPYCLTIADPPPPFVSLFGYQPYIDTRSTFAPLTTSELSLFTTRTSSVDNGCIVFVGRTIIFKLNLLLLRSVQSDEISQVRPECGKVTDGGNNRPRYDALLRTYLRLTVVSRESWCGDRQRLDRVLSRPNRVVGVNRHCEINRALFRLKLRAVPLGWWSQYPDSVGFGVTHVFPPTDNPPGLDETRQSASQTFHAGW